MKPFKAKYDLSKYPCNFNFVEWLVTATTLGATEVCIDNRRIKTKFSHLDNQTRIDNILVPACALAGVKVSFGSNGADVCGYHMDTVLQAYYEHGGIKKLKSVLPHGTVKYTVTLRNYDRYPQRNSNEAAWRRFAADIGALVIEDWYAKPIGLHERMALYCGAKMNFHVANGPAALCYFSDAPFIGVWHNVDEAYHQRHSFPIGSQLPWLNSNQKIIWQNDTYDNLCRIRP